MYATTEGTTRYIDRFPQYRDAAFYRTLCRLEVSSLGIGTYLGADNDAADQGYTEALTAAGEGGINLFDCALNYRNQRSGAASVRRCGNCSATKSWSSPRPASSLPAPSPVS